MKPFKVEYIWLDGEEPSQQIKSKTKIIYLSDRQESVGMQDIPPSSFDGTNTNQSSKDNPECLLIPAFITPDPQRSNGIIALCEVFNADGRPSSTNYRRYLHILLENLRDHAPSAGFEQKYFVFKDGIPVVWNLKDARLQETNHYCSVGTKNISARDFTEDHLNLCLSATLPITGVNAETSPGQWSIQVGGSSTDVLSAADSLIVTRFLLQRLSEKYGYTISFDPNLLVLQSAKSRLVTSFSTSLMRGEGGLEWIKASCDAFAQLGSAPEIASHYGYGSQMPVDKEAPVRIPLAVMLSKMGFFEDTRPSADANPYRVLSFLTKLACENEARLLSEKRKDQ